MNLFKYNSEKAKFNRDVIITKQVNEDFYRIYSLMITDDETKTINWGVFYKDYIEGVTNLIISLYNHITELKIPIKFYKCICFWFEYYIGNITDTISDRKSRKYRNNIDDVFEYIERLDIIRFKKELEKEE